MRHIGQNQSKCQKMYPGRGLPLFNHHHARLNSAFSSIRWGWGSMQEYAELDLIIFKMLISQISFYAISNKHGEVSVHQVLAYSTDTSLQNMVSTWLDNGI